MATAKKIPDPRPNVHLELSADEAEVVRTLCGCVSGKGHKRELAASVMKALDSVGVDCLNAHYSSHVDFVGEEV